MGRSLGVSLVLYHHWKAVITPTMSLAHKGMVTGAKPPLDLNRELMEKYRPAMRRFYLNKPVEFR
jgi:hypothetical protein